MTQDIEDTKDAFAQLLQDRGSKHGDFVPMSDAITDIERAMTKHGLCALPPYQRHALRLFAVKIGRILVGDNDFDDHWCDIAGYATRVMENLPKAE